MLNYSKDAAVMQVSTRVNFTKLAFNPMEFYEKGILLDILAPTTVYSIPHAASWSNVSFIIHAC